MMDEALADSQGSVQQAVHYLWELDDNRLVAGVDYEINPQDRTRHRGDDAARVPFFERISESVWEKPTFRSFKKLLDNYVATSGVPERVSQEEREEEEEFLSQAMETRCMQFAYRWLSENGFDAGDSTDEFKERLRELWFEMYDRGQDRDSSGFEHVFCGEIDDGKVKGLHNFVQVYVEEERGNFDYMGYLNIRGERSRMAPPTEQQMMIIRFEWMGYVKSCSSMFVGTSPEFEMALYSVMWMADAKGEVVKLGAYEAEIRMYDFDGRITTAFPELKDVDEEAMKEEAMEEGTAAEDGDEFDGSALHDGDEFPALG